MIEFYGVTKEYQGRRVLRDVTFKTKKGEFLFLTGPSGAGKTTLLKLIFHAEKPTEGQIIVNGMNVSGMPASRIPALRRSMGIVFQDYKLLPAQPSAGAALTRRCASWSFITAWPRFPRSFPAASSSAWPSRGLS